jgi:hypothetical protein
VNQNFIGDEGRGRVRVRRRWLFSVPRHLYTDTRNLTPETK